MSPFAYSLSLFRWMLDFSLAPRLQFVSVKDGFVQTTIWGICGLRWLAFWLYNLCRSAYKKAFLTWQFVLNSK